MGEQGSQAERMMEAHGHHSRMRPWMLLVPVGVIGLAVHAVILYRVLPHTALSAGVVSGAVVLIVLKHLGLLGPLYGLFRRRSIL